MKSKDHRSRFVWPRFASMGALCALAVLAAARPGPVKKLSVDPDAREVELFAAIEAGELEARLVARDARHGNLLVTNKTEDPLTVKLPRAVVGVHVLKQFLPPQNQQGAFGVQNLSPTEPSQALGVGFGGSGLGPLGPVLNNLGGMFSVPAERTVQIRISSVCLQYGKPDPASHMEYRVEPVEEFTRDAALQEFLYDFGTDYKPGRIVDYGAVQAAAWRLSNRMSWEALRGIPGDNPGGGYFTRGQIEAAHQWTDRATDAAKRRPPEEPSKSAFPLPE
jgi:hypothetical protein